MPAITSSTLFHFTKRKETLFKILKNGLRFSYCYEEFSKDSGMALPMVCFCDIPLLRTKSHRPKYGSYVIGVDKDYLLDNESVALNPVFYLSSQILIDRKKYTEVILESLEAKFKSVIDYQIKDNPLLFQKFIKEGVSCFGKNIHYELDSLSIAGLGVRYNLAFTKQIKSIVNGKSFLNYDEREWRLVIQNETDGRPNWILNKLYSDFIDNKKDLNHKLDENNNFLHIREQDLTNAITHIIVKKEKYIDQTIDFIKRTRKLFGSNGISEKKREVLISKLSSFDRIEKDY